MELNNIDSTSADGYAHAAACLRAAIEAAHPERVIAEQVNLDESILSVGETVVDLNTIENIYVLGGGNAAGHAAAALESMLGDRITDGMIVTDEPVETERVAITHGTHPLPSKENVRGTRRILELSEAAMENDLIIAVVAGGGSALLCAPADDVSLDDYQVVTDELLRSGAAIDEINAVRKHLSAVKGGRLAQATAPARMLGVVFSDVVGNPLNVIASGPTAPDDSTYQEAHTVLERYDVVVPESVEAALSRGIRGERPETPTIDATAFTTVTNHIIADANTALTAAERRAKDLGYETTILSSRIRGEAREAAKTHIAIAEEIRDTGRPLSAPAAYLSGGETTVTVRGDGMGGPNQEFALSAAIELAADGIVISSVDTDGYDGGTDAAGAIVDETTVEMKDRQVALDALANNDAARYLGNQDALVYTGATGTNVNDLRIVLVTDEDD